MRISPSGIEFIKRHEGCILYAYQNWLKKSKKWDVPTIGYGYTVGVSMGRWHYNTKKNRKCSDTTRITKQEAIQTLINKIYRYENVVRKCFNGCELTQGMYDALCSLAWNCGSFNDNLVAAIKQNPTSKTTENLFKNHRIGAADILKKRRIEEWNLFVSGGQIERIQGAVSGNPMTGQSADIISSIESSENVYVDDDENNWDGGEDIAESAFEEYYSDAEEDVVAEDDETTDVIQSPTTAALDNLMKNQCAGVSIPGLDEESVLKNLADKSPQLKFAMKSNQDILDQLKKKVDEIKAKYDENDEDDVITMNALLETLEEEKNRIIEEQKKMVEDFINENRQMVKNKINIIKVSFKSITDGTSELISTVSSAFTSISLPSFIGTGSPNPAKSVAEFVTIKHQLKAQLSPLLTSAVTLLSAAQDIMFDIPSPVSTAIGVISKVQSTIDSIPG